MKTKTSVKYRMSVIKEQRSFFKASFDKLETALGGLAMLQWRYRMTSTNMTNRRINHGA